ncbi:MAG: family 16 glycoside hydrolase, partial [Planctomycetota bacterium]
MKLRTNAVLFAVLMVCSIALILESQPAHSKKPAALRNLLIDGTGPGWKELGLSDFVNVNCDEDTWSTKDGIIHATGKPVGVVRSKKQIKNFELVVEWRHQKSAGTSGVFAWATPDSIKRLEQGKGRLPAGIEIQVLDH